MVIELLPASGGALDPIEHLYEAQRYYPEFAQSELRKEREWTLDKIKEYLAVDLNELVRNQGKFMHLMRLLNNVEDWVIPSFEEKREIALKIWELYQCPNLKGFKKTRTADSLTSFLSRILLAHVPLIWIKTKSRSSHATQEQLSEFGSQLNWKVLFNEIEKRYAREYRDPVGTSCARRKAQLTSVVRLASSARAFWDSNAVGKELEELFSFDKPDLMNAAIFYKARVLMLFCNHEFWHQNVLNGKLWKWWAFLGCRCASTWDSTFSRLLFRGIKYGWAVGQPLNYCCHTNKSILFQLVTGFVGIPTPQNTPVSFSKENIGGELTPLLDKNLNILRKLAKIIALLLEPLSGPIPLDRSTSEQPFTINGTPLPVATKDSSTWEYLQSLVSLIFPLSHPSNTGKWSSPVSHFVNAFIQAYTRRVARERMSSEVVDDRVGRICENGKPKYSNRLGRAEDKKLVDLFMPLLMQGIYSKNQQAGTFYESALKRLCYLIPEFTLEPVLEQVISALEAVTESHQLQAALRLLTQLTQLLLQRTPGIIPQLLTLTLPAIDGAEPFKTVQALTFYSVLFSQIGSMDLSSVDVEDLPIENVANTTKRLLFPKEGEWSPFISFQNYPVETRPNTMNPSTKCKANYSNTKSNTDAAISPEDFWSPNALRERGSTALVATSVIPDWVLGFFEQLLRLVTYSTKTDKNAAGLMGTVDRSFAIMTKYCLYFVVSECDGILVTTLCSTFLDWMKSNVVPDAIKLMSMITRALVQARPDICVSQLLPEVIKKLPQMEDDKETTYRSMPSITAGSTQEQTLLWYLECFSSLLRCESKFLRPHETDIISRIHWALNHESRTISRVGAKALRRAIESTCCITIKHELDLAKDSLESLKQKATNVLRWGQPWWTNQLMNLRQVPSNSIDPSAVAPIKVLWKEPTSDDMDFVKYLVSIGLHHVSQLLRFCIPEELRSAKNMVNTINDLSVFYKRPSLIASMTASAEKDVFKDWLAISLPHELISQTQVKLLCRALSVGRKILKAITPLFPDERTRICPGFPVVSNVDENLGSRVANFLSETCIAVARCHLGLVVDPKEPKVDPVQPLVHLRGVEDGAIIRKLLDAMDQILVRHWCIGGIYAQTGSNGNLWVSLNPWTSASNGIHATSLWQDQTKIGWEERLVTSWCNRVESRRAGQPFTGHRRTLLLLVSRFGDHYYAENRTLAQEILKDAFACHYGARTNIIKLLTKVVMVMGSPYIFSDLVREAKRLAKFSQIKESPPDVVGNKVKQSKILQRSESDPKLSSPKVLDEEQLEILKSPTQTVVSEQNELELCYARLTGVTYCLNHLPMLRRLWGGGAAVVSDALNATCETFKAPIGRDKLLSRLLSLAHGILNYREVLPRDSSFDNHIVQRLLRPLLSEVTSGKTSNWRFQLVATAILTVFNSEPIKSLEEEYSLWLLSASNPLSFPPLLNTLAVFCLALYLKVQLDKGALNAPESLIEKMQQESATASITYALIHAHHENCRPGPTAYPETAYQLVVDILKIDRSWPYSRTSRLSRNLSLHNCLVAQTAFEFQYATARGSTQFINPWIKHLTEFISQPVGEAEHLVAGCEIIAGCIRASSCCDDLTRQYLWQNLSPCLITAFNKLDQDLFADLLDALRYGVDTVPLKEQFQSYIPLVNLVMDLNRVPDVTEIKSVPLDFEQITAKSSLDATKRLKLFTAVMLQTRWRIELLVSALLPEIPMLIRHPYKQIRQETARCLYVIFCVGADHLCSTEFHQELESLSTTLLETIDRLTEFLKEDAAKTRDLTIQRPSELCETETLLLLIITLCKSCRADAVFDIIVKILPLVFEALKHPEVDITSTAWTALAYIARNPGMPLKHEIRLLLPRETTHYEFVNKLVFELSHQRTSTSWKVRHSAVRLAEMLGTRLRLSLHNTPEFRHLISICVNGLIDSQTEVRNQAKAALSSLVLTLSDEDCKTQTKVFMDLAGPPRQIETRPLLQVSGGVLGLIALVHSVPYHIPDWLPETITLLAKYGNSKAPDSVRRQVQQGLQEFFRTHQDAWQQSHIKKFSESQLDILETYKGRPVYFS